MILTFPHVGSTPWEFDWFRKHLPTPPRTPIAGGAGTIENGTWRTRPRRLGGEGGTSIAIHPPARRRNPLRGSVGIEALHASLRLPG